MPALCSDTCTAAWQQRYRIAFGDEPAQDPVRHTNHGCDPSPLVELAARAQDIRQTAIGGLMNLAEQFAVGVAERERAERTERGNRALVAQAPGLVLDLYRAGQLGYLAASDDWVNGKGAPLIEPLQQAAHDLAVAGQLPEFVEWFPAPAEDDRDLPVPDFSAFGTTVAEAFAGMSGMAAADAEQQRANAQARGTDEPQDLVDNSQTAFALQPSTAELLADGITPDKPCPPRPPEPPTAFAEPDSPFLARLLGALRRWRP